MESKNYQKKHLETIYRDAAYTPVFRQNPKYSINQFSNLTPYISYNDVINNKFIIRGRPIDFYSSYDSEEREIIVEYNSLDELINGSINDCFYEIPDLTWEG